MLKWGKSTDGPALSLTVPDGTVEFSREEVELFR